MERHRPVEVSSGKQKPSRLSLRGDRRHSHAISDRRAITQIRHWHIYGCAYKERKSPGEGPQRGTSVPLTADQQRRRRPLDRRNSQPGGGASLCLPGARGTRPGGLATAARGGETSAELSMVGIRTRILPRMPLRWPPGRGGSPWATTGAPLVALSKDCGTLAVSHRPPGSSRLHRRSRRVRTPAPSIATSLEEGRPILAVRAPCDQTGTTRAAPGQGGTSARRRGF
jgi:hypothetical protein